MIEKRVTAVIIFFGSTLLFFGVIYLLATDIDFFLNKQFVNGTFKVINEEDNKIKVSLSYYDNYRKKEMQIVKKLSNSYRNALHELDSNNVTIVYTKWFNQAYINEVKTPKMLILVFEIAIALFLSLGIRWGSLELFYVNKADS